MNDDHKYRARQRVARAVREEQHDGFGAVLERGPSREVRRTREIGWPEKTSPSA